MSSPINITKRNAFLELMTKCHSVHVACKKHLVRTTAPLRDGGGVVLEFGYNLKLPIPDIVADAWSLSGTLSFDGKPYFVWIPWEAIFAMYDPHETEPGKRLGFAAPSEAPGSNDRVESPSHPTYSQPAPTHAVRKSYRDALSARDRASGLGWRVIEGGKKEPPEHPDGPRAA